MIGLRSRPDTSVPTEPRISRRRRAVRWRGVRRLLVVLLVLGALAGAGWLVFASSVLAVGGATVTGVSVLEEETVAEVAEVPVGTPLARVDLDAVRARVEGLAPVRSAEVSRAWPDRVHIDVTERTAVAVVSWEGRWRGLDSAGVLFRSYAERPDEVPEVRAPVSTPVEALAEAAAVVSSLPDSVLSRLRAVEVSSIDSIRLLLRGGATVSWGSADESAAKAEVLLALLDRERARVYDVTAPGRPTLLR